MKVKSESEVAQLSLTSPPHGLQPTRLLCPWDFPGKNTGGGAIAFSGVCVCVCVCVCVYLTTEHPKYIKQKQAELKRELDNSTIMENFNISLSVMDNTTSQKISKELRLNYSMKKLDLKDICRKLHFIMAKCIFFSSVHGTFFRTSHMLGHKSQKIKKY